MIYGWKQGARQRLNAQVVGERLEQIRIDNGGLLTPEATVDDARPDDAPLHPAFEWNDEKAAEEFRLVQARELIRCVVTVPDASYGSDAPTTFRAFVIVGDRPDQAYTSTVTAMSDDAMRQQVLQRALRELRQWRNRYRELSELATIFASMDRVEDAA